MDKYPEELYITKERDGDEEFFVSSDRIEDASEKDNTVSVGLYKLVKVILVENKTSIV